MTDRKRFELPNKEKVRHLKQYQNMTDDEFEELWAKKMGDAEPSVQLEKRIEIKLREFEQDYDLDDLKINDRLVLRALIQAIINLEDLEQSSYKHREGGITPENIAMLRDVNSVANDLRKSISQMQEDLRITRKTRKGDKEATVISYLEELKKKAKLFKEATHLYIFCPECNTLLSTQWYLYPNEANKISLKCHVDGCEGVINITSKELVAMGGSNKRDLPESLT